MSQALAFILAGGQPRIVLESVLFATAEEVLASFVGLDVAENFFIRQEMQSWVWAHTAWVTNFIDLNLGSKKGSQNRQRIWFHILQVELSVKLLL